MSLAARIKAHPAVAEFWEDAANRVAQPVTDARGRRRWVQQKDYWVYLRDGWTNPVLGCGTIHETTLAEVWAQLRRCTEVTE